MDVVKKIEGEGSGSGKTKSTLTIAKSGVWCVALCSSSSVERRAVLTRLYRRPQLNRSSAKRRRLSVGARCCRMNKAVVDRPKSARALRA